MKPSASLPLPEPDEELSQLIDAADEKCAGHLPDQQAAARVRVGAQRQSADKQQRQDAREQGVGAAGPLDISFQNAHGDTKFQNSILRVVR